MAEATSSIQLKVFIPAAPDRVYAALTVPELHAAFTESPAAGDPVPGGAFNAWDGYIEGRYLELVPGQRIVCQWTTVEWPEGSPPSRVEILLQPESTGTELTMLHTEVPASQADGYRQGWMDYYWKPFERYFRP